MVEPGLLSEPCGYRTFWPIRFEDLRIQPHCGVNIKSLAFQTRYGQIFCVWSIRKKLVKKPQLDKVLPVCCHGYTLTWLTACKCSNGFKCNALLLEFECCGEHTSILDNHLSNQISGPMPTVCHFIPVDAIYRHNSDVISTTVLKKITNL